MAKQIKRPLAVLEFKKYQKIHDFIGKMRSIVLNISNAPLIFVTPHPTLASVTGHVNDLDEAQAVADTRVVGAIGQRDIKYNIVLDDLDQLLPYVQILANAAPDEVTAAAIINASGFSVKVNGVFQKPPLEARNGELSGTVLLIALGGGHRTAHDWAISANGINWTSLVPTINANTLVTGLAKLSTQYFRHRLITKDGPEAWSQVVSIVVL